eukprot:5209404-Pyramimonas_sp.AAC.1
MYSRAVFFQTLAGMATTSDHLTLRCAHACAACSYLARPHLSGAAAPADSGWISKLRCQA